MKLPHIVLLILLLPITTHARSSAPWVGHDLKGRPCQSWKHGYGPYDYTKASDRPGIPIVEEFHFTPDVENHKKGKSGSIQGDLAYTIGAVPNHHRALLSIIRYQQKYDLKMLNKKEKPLEVAVECYLQRAINFSPRDVVSITLYANYLKKSGELETSANYYKKALRINPKSPKLLYFYSELLVELKEYDKALKYAKAAYAKGKPPEHLRKKLIELGVWK